MALLIETSNHYSRELLQGIRDYLREGVDWALHLTEQGRGGAPPTWLARWRGKGIIARIENKRIERAVSLVGVPVVNVSASGVGTDFPRVISSSVEVAGLAAEHLMELGLRRFGYCGEGRFLWSHEHAKHFVHRLAGRGFPCSVYHSSKKAHEDWEHEKRRLKNWLLGLEKPAGVMACYDIRGQQILDVCREVGIRVPEDLAVIGQHDDKLLCNLCDPPLSSVIPNPRRSGYVAAGLLDRMMRGKKVRVHDRCIPPTGVAVRHSTDVVAVRDRTVSEALRFIRTHALEGITINDVLAAVPVSRTMLERRFRAVLARSPYEEIQRIRLAKAKELLVDSGLTIGEISEIVGYSSPEYMSAVFKKKVGLSPRAYTVALGRGKGKGRIVDASSEPGPG